MIKPLIVRSRLYTGTVIAKRIVFVAVLACLPGCQYAQHTGPADPEQPTSGPSAVMPPLPVPNAPPDPAYAARPGHKAEATAAPVTQSQDKGLNHNQSESQKDANTTAALRSQVFNQPSPVTAALAALEACEERRANHPAATAPCELRRRGAKVIHSTNELLHGLQPTRPAFLWRIKSSGTTVYLAGSIHVLKPTLNAPPSYYDAFDESAELVLEVDRSALSPPALQSLVRELGLLPQGQTLSDLYVAEDVERVRSYLSTLGMSLESVQQLKPAMLLLQSGVMEYTSMGYLASHGVDNVFEGLRGERELQGLETMREQLQAATALPIELQAELLLETINEAPAATRQISDLVRAWLSGDTQQLHQQFINDTESEAARRWLDDLLAKRNVNMAARIATFLAPPIRPPANAPPRTLFVLVGAAHLVGPDSVVELLQNKGFTAQQMQYASLQPSR